MKKQKGGDDTDNETSQKLYEAYYMKVYSYLVSLCGNRDMAEEITQETFFRAMTTKKAFRGESSEASWLCAIAKNIFYDEMRRNAHQDPSDIPEELQDHAKPVDDIVSDEDASFRIHQILHDLEDPYKEVFELRCFGELSFQKIGTIFGKTENWARVTYHRARLKIHERVNHPPLEEV